MFYSDSHKLYLEFYGHSLPITTFTITSDSYLLLSGSVDKTVKIWGTDFGNCRRSIYAHQDTVNNIVAVPDTHYFFSVSNDASIKYWDADTNQLILVFNDSLSKITNIAVNSIGDSFFIVA